MNALGWASRGRWCLKTIVSICAVLFICCAAQARVFDFKNEHFSIYFGGSFGTTSLGDGAYALVSAFPTAFDKKATTASDAEGGISIGFGRLNLRLGVDYLMPRVGQGIIATDRSQNTLYQLNSSVTAFSFIGDVEYIARQSTTSRALIGAGYGVATVNLSNQYTLTSAGQTTLGAGNYTENATGIAPLMQGYAAYEVLFTDTATATISAGYRYLVVSRLTSTSDATSLNGAEANGNRISNYDGSDRVLNLSGGYVGIVFKFYL